VHYNDLTEGQTEILKIDAATMNLEQTFDKMKMKFGSYFPRGFGRMFQ
jgi:hypothetical protein